MLFKLGTLREAGEMDCILLFVTKDDGKAWEEMKFPHAEMLAKILATKKDAADYKKFTTTYIANGRKLQKLVIVGLGSKNELCANKVRKAVGEAVRTLDAKLDKNIMVIAPFMGCEHGLATMVNGLSLGAYRFEECKGKPDTSAIESVTIVTKLEKAAEVMADAVIMADNVKWVRDLVNRPGNIVNPLVMADTAKDIAGELGLECEILDVKAMKKKGMNSLLAVAQGSDTEPRLIALTYRGGDKKDPFTAFVGKGVTFDSGGISLKPGAGMGEMKDDMSGAAAVIGAIKTIAELRLPVNVIAVAGCVENMPSGHAQRPGDVVKAANGKTIEVVNTDAEGRMVLADAVWYACNKGAKTVIDLATLTGACIIALGNDVAAIIDNDKALQEKIIAAGERCGEIYWPLPSVPELKEALKSDVADIVNSAGREGGTITGGLFIGEFVAEGVSWAHLDIAGVATSAKPRGIYPKGAMGFGMMTLVELVR